MLDLSPTQLAGGALVAAGIIWWLAPQLWTRLKAVLPDKLPDFTPDPMTNRLTRLQRLSEVQDDLEARGHVDEAKTAGGWYDLLRKEAGP